MQLTSQQGMGTSITLDIPNLAGDVAHSWTLVGQDAVVLSHFTYISPRNSVDEGKR
jgi:hypothetical protein